MAIIIDNSIILIWINMDKGDGTTHLEEWVSPSFKRVPILSGIIYKPTRHLNPDPNNRNS